MTTAVLRNTFEASFPLLPVCPVPGGPVCASVSDNKSRTNLSIGDVSGVFAGVGTAGVNTVSNLFSNSSI